jgi:hypothetical protein
LNCRVEIAVLGAEQGQTPAQFVFVHPPVPSCRANSLRRRATTARRALN